MKIIGLMSGTSGDGIDAVLCEITGAPPHINATIIAAITQPYDPALRQRILASCRPEESRVDDLCQLNFDLSHAFVAAARRVIETAELEAKDIDLVSSHGQTVWHNVLPDGRVNATLQIGEAAVIAEETGITTISNLRARDVAAGGQGAPLAGYLDWLLLRHPDHWRAVQNIGGIGNVTFLPPLSDTTSDPVCFDTGPGNVLIDTAVSVITGSAQTYDQDGERAAQGQIDEAWLADLMTHPYYAQQPPKTTGREVFGADMGAALVSEGRMRKLADNDIIATLTALTAANIADAYQRFAPTTVNEVIIGGGGARNPTLMTMLGDRLAPAPVIDHEAIGLDSESKEGLLFALLAYEAWHNRPGTHPALTGARHGSVLGQITPGANMVDLLRRTWNTPD